MNKYTFIQTKKDLKDWISLDKERNFKTQRLSAKVFKQFTDGGRAFLLLKTLRKAEYHTNRNHRIRSFFYRVLLRHYENKFGVAIPLNVVGPGLRIEHPIGIIINKNAKIGAFACIHQFLTIGDNGKNNLAPTIGNNCYIGANVSIIGNITIGDNVIIGAGAVVTKSFQSGVAIGGVPAKEL